MQGNSSGKSILVRAYEVLAVFAAIGIVATSLGAVWFITRPIYPVLDHVSYEVARPEGAPLTVRAFESRRVVCNRSRHPVTGTLYAEIIEEPPEAEAPRVTAAGEVISDAHRRLTLGSARLTLLPGCQTRIRVWSIPPGLQHGEHVYWYSAVFEVCDWFNQCEVRGWPPVRLPDDFIP